MNWSKYHSLKLIKSTKRKRISIPDVFDIIMNNIPRLHASIEQKNISHKVYFYSIYFCNGGTVHSLYINSSIYIPGILNLL